MERLEMTWKIPEPTSCRKPTFFEKKECILLWLIVEKVCSGLTDFAAVIQMAPFISSMINSHILLAQPSRKNCTYQLPPYTFTFNDWIFSPCTNLWFKLSLDCKMNDI